MKTKSVCLVCRGADINCRRCEGSGWVEVNLVSTTRPEISEYKTKTRKIRKSGITDKILQAISEWQKKYLQTLDVKDFRPMILADIAKASGVHPATVCMYIRDQYIDGISVKDLFSISTKSGISRKSALKILEDVIKNAKSPHSDRELVELMEEQGIKICRRTVTKYRNELGLKPSR